jgi:class 3 adenylate cyclase/streptogramin lyase
MTELPRGAVTFLFTDIEGSTRLVKRFRDRYAAVLMDHQRLLREAFARHGGHEIDTQGDSFFVAFEHGRDAVLAAADGQEALRSHAWPDGGTVKVRMAVHTGQASPTDGRYTGLAVHRGARICAAGHGGQVLVSQATRELLDEEEDVPLQLRELGVVALKDLDRPVRLYQLSGDGLAERFPPLRGTESRLRRWRVPIAIGAAAVVGGIAAAVVLLTGGEGVTVEPNSVAVIDPANNRIIADVSLGSQAPRASGSGFNVRHPRLIDVGAGRVWVLNPATRTVTRIDPATLNSTTIGLTAEPISIDAGPDGAWVSEGTSGLQRIRPDSTTPDPVVRLSTTREFAPSAEGVAVGADTVWVGAALLGTLELARVDSVTGEIVKEVPVGSRADHSLAVDRGAVWMTNQADNRLLKVDAVSGQKKRRIAIAAPGTVAAGGGFAWVTDAIDDKVLRVGRTREVFPVHVGQSPVDVAVGEGAVWVANYGDGSVSRVDPHSRRVQPIQVAAHVSGIAAGAGRVWVLVP